MQRSSGGSTVRDADPERRTFLDALLAFGFVSTAIAVVYPVSRYVIPPRIGEPATASVQGARLSALTLNSAVLFKFGARPGLLVRTPEGDLRAFSPVPRHLGCSVQRTAGTSHICGPCHNGLDVLGG